MPRAKEEITREQLESLRHKFDLLQGDRKAYFETYETTKRSNDKLLKDLRQRNKELRRELAALQKEAVSGASKQSDTTEKLNRDLLNKRKEYDQLKAKARAKKQQKDQLAARLRDLEQEGRKPTTEDSPLMRKIRMLENRLDKAMIKYNEAQSIKKTYEQIVKRLKDERVGFDNQLSALERTLESKKKDLEELGVLAGDANHAKEVAIRELERVRAFAKEDQERRARQLREKENLAKQKSRMDEISRERAKLRQDIVQEVAGDLGLEEEEQLKQTLEQNKRMQEVVAEETEAQRRKIAVYEEAFRRIKEATGVSDVNEVIQKVLSQEEQHKSLQNLTKENASRIETLNSELSSLKQRVDELKFSGTGGRTGARKMVDSFEEKLSASQQRLERAKEKFERLMRILINTQAGVNHLVEKLASVRGVEEQDLQTSTDENDVVDVLYHCEASMANVLGKVKQFEEELRSARKKQKEDAGESDSDEDLDDAATGALLMKLAGTGRRTGGQSSSQDAAGGTAAAQSGAASGNVVASLGITEDDIAATRVYNTRIDLHHDEMEKEAENDDEELELVENIERDEIKRASDYRVTQRLKQQQQRRQPKRRGAKA